MRDVTQLLNQMREDTARTILQKISDKCNDLVADNSPDSIDFVEFARDTLIADLAKEYKIEIRY